MAKPSELYPDQCAKFVTYLHEYREQSGAAPVTDEVAIQAFDIMEGFMSDFVLKRAGLETRPDPKECPTLPIPSEPKQTKGYAAYIDALARARCICPVKDTYEGKHNAGCPLRVPDDPERRK